MPGWGDLLSQFNSKASDQAKQDWLQSELTRLLGEVSALRNDRVTLMYMSGFLQKPQAPPTWIQITHEDLNGFMTTIHGAECAKGLTLILHTPGGATNAAETLVAYLRSKFTDIEVIVPALAMSAGTMIALSADKIVMGRQSQLGPIDPQMPIASTGRYVSAQAIKQQFEEAKAEILGDPRAAHAWVPITQSLGFGLLVEAQNALDYSQQMVEKWLAAYMFARRPDGPALAATTAAFFNDASLHKSHGRRIDRDEARSHDVDVDDLEDSSGLLQDAVLSAYHLATIAVEQSSMAKMIWRTASASWIKNWVPPQQVIGVQQPIPVVQPPNPAPANRQQRRHPNRR